MLSGCKVTTFPVNGKIYFDVLFLHSWKPAEHGAVTPDKASNFLK